MTHEEAIIEARRKIQAGDFQRAVVKVMPEDLDYDRIVLECGHTKVWSPNMMPGLKHVDTMRERCTACAEEWVKAETKAGR